MEFQKLLGQALWIGNSKTFHNSLSIASTLEAGKRKCFFLGVHVAR